MSVEILHTVECPGWELTVDLAREALDELGLDATPVSVRLIDSAAAARRTGFGGSPTVLIDGSDPFPSAGPTDELACRVYPSAEGLSPHPSYGALVDALRPFAR